MISQIAKRAADRYRIAALRPMQFYVTYPLDWEDDQAIEAANNIISKTSGIGRVIDYDVDPTEKERKGFRLGRGYITLLLEADPAAIYPQGDSFSVEENGVKVESEMP
jgi:hypothetical protein